MASRTEIDRDWISKEFSRGIDAEKELLEDAKARAESPPDPSLGVLYHEIAAADERHRAIIETIATRYGHVPARSVAGGIGETLGRLKDKVSEMGSSPMQLISHDLNMKANAVHWSTAWVLAFEAIGDAKSAARAVGRPDGAEIPLRRAPGRTESHGAARRDRPGRGSRREVSRARRHRLRACPKSRPPGRPSSS